MSVVAKFGADFTSFQTAVQAAELKLRDFEQGAGKVQTSLNKMANSLSGTKLIQDATLMVEAVNRVGGVSRLTESELARVSAQAKEAAAKLVAMGQDVPPGIQRIADAGKNASGVFGDLSSQVKATALGFVSAQAVIGGIQTGFRTLTAFIGSSIDSYASAEAAAKKMTAALQAQGTATPAVIARFNDLASSFQRTTVYSDDLINEMEALLTQVGDVAPAEMGKALTAATDLASGLGIDLRAATILVSKASEENVGALKKAGVQLDETRVKGEGMSYILGEIEKKFGGQAQSEIETYAGKVKQLANEWDNFKEAVGKSIVSDSILALGMRQLTTQTQDAAGAAGGLGASALELWTRLTGGGTTSALFVRWLEDVADRANTAAAGLAKLNAVKFAIGHVTGEEQEAENARKAAAAAEALAAAQKKAAEGAKQHAAALETLFQKFSGGAATAQLKDLDAVFRRLNASGSITEDQISAVVKEAIKLQTEGGKLSPALTALLAASNAWSPGLSQNALDVSKLGEQVRVNVSDLTAFGEAMKKIASLPPMNIGDLGFKVGTGAKDLIKDAEDFQKHIELNKKAVGDLAQAFAQMAQVAGGSLGSVIQEMGTLITSFNTAQKGLDSFQAGKKAGGFAGFAEMTAGIMGIASAALAAGQAIKGLFDHFFGTAGRTAVTDFAATFGGFDALHAELSAKLPADAEKLWIALTQGVGRNNPEQAKAAIDAITKALADQESQTGKSAQAAVDAANAQQDALDEITKKYADTIGKLDSEWQSLAADVAKEAPEEFMGIVEANERARMADLENQKRAQEAMRDAEIEAKKSTFAEMLDAGQKVDDALREMFGKPYKMGAPEWPAGTPGASGSGYYTPPAAAAGMSPGGGGSKVIVPVYIDGRQVAEAVVPHIPAVVDSYGLTR